MPRRKSSAAWFRCSKHPTPVGGYRYPPFIAGCRPEIGSRFPPRKIPSFGNDGPSVDPRPVSTETIEPGSNHQALVWNCPLNGDNAFVYIKLVLSTEDKLQAVDDNTAIAFPPLVQSEPEFAAPSPESVEDHPYFLSRLDMQHLSQDTVGFSRHCHFDRHLCPLPEPVLKI
jgi:hypothetical protein